ncbi:MAG: HlyD family efflux transporter periplasmic adaptor subunit [Acidobacteriaceae bacterium]|nr:HlyD family efflux transporter periplasmic adaptor subunit [Acidobacteriaceae bacterium]
MANSFHRVSESLRRDNGIRSIAGLLVGLGLIGAWMLWSFKAHVTEYEVSDSARLEVNGAAYPVQANASGRLVASGMVLGREVQAGEVLAELDSNDQRLSLKEEQTRLASLMPQVQVLQSQMELEQEGRGDERRVLGVSIEGAKAQYEEAEAQASLADRDAERASRLRAEGIISDADAQRAKADAQSKRAAAENLKDAMSRLEPELQVRERDREVRLKQILEDTTKLQAEIATSSATVRRLEYEIEQRQIRAPISGRIGETAPLRSGSHISEGQQLGVILPQGKLEVVAEFQPSAALGKVRPGQPAILRLQGFPWAQYGSVPARVAKVAGEIRDGKVRVELTANPRSGSRISFQHGLPGSVEVEVERLSPAALILRSAGNVMGQH